MIWVIACSIFVVNAQSFFSEQEENLIYYSPDIAPTAVCVGDIDSDGDQDILSFFDKKFRLFNHSDGNGTFSEREEISAPDDWILPVGISDLNENGRQDILAASYNNNKIIWYENNGKSYKGQWYNPRDGMYIESGQFDAKGGSIQLPEFPGVLTKTNELEEWVMKLVQITLGHL